MNGKGGHGQNDERVAEPPTGSINGNFMKHKWILIENNGDTMTFLNNIVEMKMYGGKHANAQQLLDILHVCGTRRIIEFYSGRVEKVIPVQSTLQNTGTRKFIEQE